MPMRAFTPQEMLLTERRRLEIPLLAMIWVSGTAASLAMGNLFDLGATAVAVGVNVLAVFRSREIYVRRLLVNASVIAATMALCLELAGSLHRLLDSLQHYLILIQLCKLFERKSNRDYVQMLVMSLLLMVAAGLGMHTLWFAASLLVYLVLACYVAMALTLKRGLDDAGSARLSSEASPLAPQRVAWNVIRDWPSGVLLRRVASMIVAMLAVGAIVFLSAPRGIAMADFTNPMGNADTVTSGFSRVIHLGDARGVYLSDRVAMHVRLRPQSSGGALPTGPLYLRGRAYDTYGQGASSAWDRSAGGVSPLSWPPVPREVLDDSFVQEVTMAGSLLPTVFGQWPIVHTQPLPSQGETWRQSVDGHLNLEWGLSPAPLGPARYEVTSVLPQAVERHAAFLAGLREQLRERMSDPRFGVFIHPRVEALARGWCDDLLARRDELGDAESPALDELNLAIARRLADRLRGTYAYTLDLSESDPSRDGVEDFLFYTRKGHCEYFASALTVMCRSLGVQARLATGFLVEGPFEEGTSVPVRERDAHAWTEVFTPSSDWIVLDATPAGSLSPARKGSWWARLRDRLGDWQFSWYDRIVGYDAVHRQQLGRTLTEMFQGFVASLRSAAEGIRDSIMNLLIYGQVDRAMAYLMCLIAVVAMGIEALLLRSALTRVVQRKHQTPAERDLQQLDFVLKLFVLMERRGLVSRLGQTLRQSAQEARRQFALEEPPLMGLVDLYNAVRWGRQALAREDLCKARIDAQRLSEAIKVSAGGMAAVVRRHVPTTIIGR